MSGTPELFESYGLTLGATIVDAETLDVFPAADRLLEAASGKLAPEAAFGDLTWTGGPALHAVAFRTTVPVPSLGGLSRRFAKEIARANTLLARLGGQLLPGGAHPWMNPLRDTDIWPHEPNPVYQAVNRIFHCQGHGWANAPGLRLSLPFAGDEDFGRLHAAVRLLLPIMPALAAASPVLEDAATGFLDSALEAVRHNCERVPSVAGNLVPERAFTRREYEKRILKPLFKALRPHDKEGLLRHEWINARGAVARFEARSLDIRVLDSQECPAADLAVAALVAAAVRAVAAETWLDFSEQTRWEAGPLAEILETVARDAQSAVVANPDYLWALGLTNRRSCSAGEIWLHLTKAALPTEGFDPDWGKPLEIILTRGSLAARLMEALAGDFRRGRLREVYARLCACLEHNESFLP